MSNLQLSQLDYVYKKTIANAVKTDTLSTAITADSEKIPTAMINSAGNVWAQTDILYQGVAGALTQGVVASKTYIKMTSVHGVGTSQDYANLVAVAWSSGITGWVGPEYGFGYTPSFIIGPSTGTPPNTGGIFFTIVSSLSFPFTFDYKSGSLSFLNGVPNSPYNLSSVTLSAGQYKTDYSIWVSGYTYSGATVSSALTNIFSLSSSSRFQTFTIPQVLNFIPPNYGYSSFMDIFSKNYSGNSDVNTSIQSIFNDPGVSMVEIVMPFTISIPGGGNEQGGIQFIININGNPISSSETGRILISPMRDFVVFASGFVQTYASSLTTNQLNLTFVLIKGVDYTVGAVNRVEVLAKGAYNYGYYANYNQNHANADFTTKGRVIGFK